MGALKIDFDRDILYEVSPDRRPRGGVTMKKDPETGADVFMYKADPGVYYSANGVEVSLTMAKRAGFDVERNAFEKNKREKVRDFEAKFNAQLKSETRRIVKERKGFVLVELPENRYVIEDGEGNKVTQHVAIGEKMGMDWLTDLAGPETEVEAKADGDVQRANDTGEVGTDRRSAADGRAGSDVGKPGRPKVAIPA